MNRGTAISAVFGFGLAIIGIGEILLETNPEWISWKTVDESPMLLGHWFMVIGFAIAIGFSIVRTVVGFGKDKPNENASIARGVFEPEKVEFFLDKYSDKLTASILLGVGLLGYGFGATLFPLHETLIDVVFGLTTVVGGGMWLWEIARLGDNK